MRRYSLLLLLLVLVSSAQALSIVRGPYLQSSTPNSIKILWRTDAPGACTVRYGNAPNNLTQVAAADTATGVNHAVQITGLQPKTTYYYSIEFNSAVLAGGNDQHHFLTNPVPGDSSEFNIWVTGDFGAGNNSQIAVKRWFHNHIKTNTVHSWIWLGDNVYDDGKDAEYQAKVFDTYYGYDSIFRFQSFYPIPGNHDYNSVTRNNDPKKDRGPYYNMVDVPRNGEAGGIGTGTETFYSFDYGNIHFLALNSEPLPYTIGLDQAMKDFIKQDLQSTSLPFKVAYWHQPPYSKGSHDSDDGWELIMKAMREDYLPILEQYGVDLILNGHSHVYERSFLINKHYGLSGGYNPATHLVNGSSGNPDVDSAYVKLTYGPTKNTGTVYAVVGNSGKNEPENGEMHPVMIKKLANNESGSMILSVKGKTMTGTYYRSDGAIIDKFAIVKKDTTIVSEVRPLKSVESVSVFPNPFKKELTVELNLKQSDQLTLSIVSVEGKMQALNIFSGTVSAGRTRLELSDKVSGLAAGNYLLQISNKEGTQSEQLVKL